MVSILSLLNQLSALTILGNSVSGVLNHNHERDFISRDKMKDYLGKHAPLTNTWCDWPPALVGCIHLSSSIPALSKHQLPIIS
ncbi:hypothetical protein QBC47DRAFT_16241 [Echria macrotheca]|uniref:Uncharacterized protein n=1 Tax=Echria macrotheca TaxID=438768 RepID=A0AAJ0BRV6_9PEZI|nr:hypothetical protein QBC47DRAFT_16241 [Echria macrotheca]